MATEVGSLYYDLSIDGKKLKSQLDDADKHVKGFGDKLNRHWENSVNASQKILAGLTVVTGAAIAFGAASVKSFMESEKAQAALANTLKSTNNVSGQTLEGMNKLASQLQSTTGFTDEFVGTAQNMLLTFTQIGKDVFPQATKATLDMARQFGGDAQQNAIRLGKALNDPIQGVGALAKIGVQFSDVQKQQIENFMKAGDIMSAQKVILGEISTQTKGAAEAYGKTFAGQIDILKASFDDLQEGLGQLLVGALKPLTALFAGWIKQVNEAGGFMEYFGGIIQRNKDRLIILAGAILGTLVPAVVAMAVAFGGFLITIAPWALLGAGIALGVQKIVQHFGGWDETMRKLQPVLENLKRWFIEAKKFGVEVWTAIKTHVDDVRAAVMLLVTGDFKGGIFGLTEDSPVIRVMIIIRNVVQDVITVVVKLATFVASIVIPTFNILKGVFDFLAPSVVALFKTLWNDLLPALQHIWESVVRLWNALNPALMEALKIVAIVLGGILLGAIWVVINVINLFVQALSFVINIIATVIGWLANLIGWYGNVWGAVINLVKGIGEWFGRLPGYARDAVNGVVGWVKSIPGSVKGAIGDAYNLLFGVGKWIIWGLKDGMLSVLNSVKDAVGNVAGTVKNSLKNLLGIKSPSRVFMEIGKNVTAGFAQGINDSTDQAIKAMTNLGNNVIAPSLNVTNTSGAGAPATRGADGMATTINIGTIQDRQDADYLLRRLDRDSFLASQGLSPA